MSQVAVLTVTYNNTAQAVSLFQRALLQAAQQLGAGHEVSFYYIDNGLPSGLGSGAALPTVCLPSEGNIGYGPAMHRLWQAAFADGVDAVVTANPDGAFHAFCLRELQQMAAIYPKDLIEARQFPEEHPKPYRLSDGVTPWASGCSMWVSRELYESVGGLDAGFWLYMEDVDYSWRVRAHGRHVRLCADALYSHDVVARGPSAFATSHMLLSGRRLAFKWRNDKFQQWCEKLYGTSPPQEALPDLGGVERVEKSWTGIADFKHRFSFCKPRWGG